MRTIVLLIFSNIFMTIAWYGHLRFRSAPLWEVIVVSWLIAFLEYCFQVPANRIGSYQFSAAQLKVMQEIITLVVFSVFSILYFKEPLKWNYAGACVLIVGAVALVFYGGSQTWKAPAHPVRSDMPSQSATQAPSKVAFDQ